MQETLICAAGDHRWTRERKRGVKPDYCPEHKPAKNKPKPAVVMKEPASKVKVEALDLLTGEYYLDREFRLKLEAVVEYLGDPDWIARREPGDVESMEQNQTRLLREYQLSGWSKNNPKLQAA